MIKKGVTFAGLVLLALSLGCAKEPVEKVQAVDDAIAAARTEDVEQYAAESLQAAEQTAAEFQQEIAAQREATFYSRSYKKAEQLADAAQAAAQQAVTDAAENKEKVRLEAIATVERARPLLAEARAMLREAPVGKGNRADIEAMKADLDAADAALAAAESEIQAERFRDGLLKAEEAERTAEAVKAGVLKAKEMLASTRSRKA